ncbi:MAG TPA: DUF5908 family protein [Saprospiraceae bacterium]|nr:DUF5908 family protein [Saprospiraceae bacterium]
MPIIVRELVIRAKVEDIESTNRSSPPSSPSAQSRGMSDSQIENIVALCVEKTLLALSRNKER